MPSEAPWKGWIWREASVPLGVRLPGGRKKFCAAVEGRVERGEITFIEAILNQELGEPFRRDAMKKPVEVAGIDASDMRVQKGA